MVYAGTWHLAWKTADGGANWQHINKGMIDDSDVFSIIVDSTNPSVVFASACSGIYKSDTAGDLFRKIQGIPFSARRTRVLKQDPSNPATVYAGTTEGLWKTHGRGKTWKHVTNPEVVVNDVMVDPRNSNRVLLATDRSGVLASDDGAQTFAASNHGYTHRYVSSILADKNDPNTHLRRRGERPRVGRRVLFPRWRPALAAEERRPGRPRCIHAAAGHERRADRRNQPRHVPAGPQCQPVASDQQHRRRRSLAAAW